MFFIHLGGVGENSELDNLFFGDVFQLMVKAVGLGPGGLGFEANPFQNH